MWLVLSKSFHSVFCVTINNVFLNHSCIHVLIITFTESSSSHSDDVAAEHPQVTKIVRIILERCDGEETRVPPSPS